MVRYESKYALIGSSKNNQECDAEIDKVIDELISKILELDKKYPKCGVSDTEVRETILSYIEEKFP